MFSRPIPQMPNGGSEKHKDLRSPGQSNPKFSVSGEAARTGRAALWDVPGAGGGIPRGWEMQQAAPSGWPSMAPGERTGFIRGCIKRQVERPEQPGRGGSGCRHSWAPRMEGADRGGGRESGSWRRACSLICRRQGATDGSGGHEHSRDSPERTGGARAGPGDQEDGQDQCREGLGFLGAGAAPAKWHLQCPHPAGLL